MMAGNAKAFLLLGSCQELDGKLKDAGESYDRAVVGYPGYFRCYVARSRVRAQLGDQAGALEDLNKAIKIAPNVTDTYAHRGRLEKQSGHASEAQSDFRKALGLDPSCMLARENLDDSTR